MSRLGFVIDMRRCIGCDTCAVACHVENQTAPGHARLKVYDSHRDPVLERPHGVFPELQQHWLPTMCQHCEDAPCVQACPTAALWGRDDGLVLLDTDKCIGCQRCEEACPYDALTFNEYSGAADKCSACEHRLADGRGPACEMVCPTRAIHFGDFDDPASPVALLVRRGDSRALNDSDGAKPKIRYLQP